MIPSTMYHCAMQDDLSPPVASDFPARRRPSSALVPRLSCADCDGRFRLTPSFLPPAARAASASFPGALHGLSPAVWVLSARARSRCRCASSWASPRSFCKRTSRITRQHGQDKRKGCTRGRVIPFAERAPVGRHTLSGAPIKYDQAAAELGIAGALGGWAHGRKGALSANYSILCNFV